MKNQRKLAIIGNGRLANIVVDAYKEGLLDGYTITGIFGRTEQKTLSLAERARCRACNSIAELLIDEPEYVAEAASVSAVRQYALDVLKTGAQLVVLSIGAFADENFYVDVKQSALEHETKVHLVSGAIGGFDIMRTITLMGNGNAQAGISINKSPSMLEGTPLYNDNLLKENVRVFEGNAKEAIDLLPTQVNVAVSTSLATLGPENMQVTIDSKADLKDDEFNIYVTAEDAKVKISIVSAPHLSSGWALVARLQNLISPIVF